MANPKRYFVNVESTIQPGQYRPLLNQYNERAFVYARTKKDAEYRVPMYLSDLVMGRKFQVTKDA